MRKGTAAAITTTCIGVAAAGTALMLSNNKDMQRRTRTLRRNTGKAMRQVGHFLENASYMMR